MSDTFNGLSIEAVASLLDWFAVGRQGVSSKTIARAILGKPATDEDYHPLDLGDYGRCQSLVQSSPEIEDAFKRIMPGHSVYWKHLCAVWDTIQYYIDHGERDKAYALMDFAKNNAALEHKKETQ